jgi:hypothetical protein
VTAAEQGVADAKAPRQRRALDPSERAGHVHVGKPQHLRNVRHVMQLPTTRVSNVAVWYERAIEARSQSVGFARSDPTSPRRVLALSVVSPPEATSNTNSLATPVWNAIAVVVKRPFANSERTPASTLVTCE